MPWKASARPEFGIIAQPLTYYLKELGWTPVGVAAFLALFNFPWVIKPVFGLVSDFVPLFGYRRRGWLVLASLVAIAAYAWTATVTEPGRLAVALVATAYAMSMASTICGALLVERGQALQASSAFVTQQWLWFNVATLATSVAGGVLVDYLAPAAALHTGAAIAAAAPIAILVGGPLLVDEERGRASRTELRKTAASILASLRSLRLWVIGGFLFLYSLSPGFGTPLYFLMTDELKFSQAYIGVLNGLNAVGWILGALLHRRLLADLTLKALLNLSILMGTLSTLAFLLLQGPISAAIVNLTAGIAGMVANIATLTLAADYCPKRAEGFTFAALMSIINLAAPVSDTTGAFLYERVFGSELPPLVLLSAAFTAAAFLLVPLLRLGAQRQGEPRS